MPDPTQFWPAPTPLSEVLAEKPSGSSVKDRVVDMSREELVAQDLRDKGIPPLKGQVYSTEAVPVAEKENTRHRLVAMLFAQGCTAKDVFVQLGGQFDDKNQTVPGSGLYSLEYIRTLRRQPWFQALILEIMDAKGGDLVKARLEIEVMPSIETMVEIRDSSSASATVRLAAANSLLDRFLGKPTQTVQALPEASTRQYESERERLEKELQRLQEELHHLNPANSNLKAV